MDPDNPQTNLPGTPLPNPIAPTPQAAAPPVNPAPNNIGVAQDILNNSDFMKSAAPAPAPTPGTIISGDGGLADPTVSVPPANVSVPVASTPPANGSVAGVPVPPAGVIAGNVSPLIPPPPPAQSSLIKKLKKPLLIGLAASVLLVGSASAYYFGYKVNPSIVLSQSLSNTGKGYSKLVDYVDQQSKVHYKGTVGKGSYTVKAGGVSADGNFSFNSNGDNSDANFDLGYGKGTVKAEVRTIKLATGSTPDFYLKASGISALGALTGSTQIDSAIKQYDGKWIVVDKSLLDSLGGLASVAGASRPAASTATSQNYPTEAQIMDEARAFGRVSQQYVFTTAKDKSVTKVVKRYGVETVDGHKAYHYKMALNPDHVKSYIIAQQAALKASKLDAWLKKTNSEADVTSTFKSMEDSTKDIKTSDTFDLWADVNTRMVYKIRVSDKGNNAASNYVDIGLDYKGGTSYPLFISGQSKSSGDTSSGVLVFTIDSKSHSVGLKLTGKSRGSFAADFNANFTFTPTNNVTKVDVPTGAVPLSQVLNQLGLSDLLSSGWGSSAVGAVTSSSTSGQNMAQDSKRKSDVLALQTQLEAFFAENGNYPSLSDMNDASWVSDNMSSLDTAGIVDPASSLTSMKLVSAAAPHAYSYEVTDSDGKSCESDDTNCAKYTVTATLSDGTTYDVTNLD